jgi:4-hydroxy-tetrahydrodipicolinate reductase
MINIVLTGAKGRMGRRIAKLASEAPDFRVIAEVDIGDSLDDVIENADVVVDFSISSVAGTHAEISARRGKPIVIGTTGLTPSQEKMVQEASKKVAVVFAPNMSLGVNLMWKLSDIASSALKGAFHIDIEETHHVHKLDRPSGTAKKLINIVCPTDAVKGECDIVYLEDDKSWTRKGGDSRVSCRSIRKDEVVGDHSIDFSNSFEKLTISHHAESRDAFARGALAAVRWIKGKPAGLYGMDDVLGLK